MQDFEARLLKIIPRPHCEICESTSSYRFEAPTDLEYQAGQFFIIDITIKEKTHRHHFSFSSSPTERGYFEFTTRLRDSEFKNILRTLKVGDVVSIKAPYGRFILEPGVKKVALLSGGIGIAPIRGICKECFDKKKETDIILLYGNHREDDILYRTEFNEMQIANPFFKIVYTIEEPPESWEASSGFIDLEMIQTEIPDYLERIFYICGPPPMVSAIEEILSKLNVPKEQIKKELFTGYSYRTFLIANFYHMSSYTEERFSKTIETFLVIFSTLLSLCGKRCKALKQVYKR